MMINPKLINPDIFPSIAKYVAAGERFPLRIAIKIHSSVSIVITALHQMEKNGHVVHVTGEDIEKNGWYLTSKGVKLLDKAAE